MLTFENYIFNFHMWLHALAAATPQREAALGFSRARETIISIGKFTKMFNLLLNCQSHFMKHFSKPLQNESTGRTKRLLGRAFSSCCGQAVTSWWVCEPLPTRGRGSRRAWRAGMPKVLQPFTKPTWRLSTNINHSPSLTKMQATYHTKEGTGGSN